jgi:hypothetical protein
MAAGSSPMGHGIEKGPEHADRSGGRVQATAAQENTTRPMENMESAPCGSTPPAACFEIIRTNPDPGLRIDAAVHLLALIEDGKEVDEGEIRELRAGERDLAVRNKLSRVLNKLGIRRLCDDDPTSYYDPKLSLEEELRLYEEIERLKGVYDKSKNRPGAFDEKYMVFNIRIGTGGMAKILRGLRRSDNRPVAIKYLMLEDLSQFASVSTLTALFRNEGRLLCEKLDHPKVIKGFEFGVADGNYFIVLEYVEGGSLYDAIRKEPVDLDTFRGIGLQMCDGLEYIHREGVIHRDINPNNLLIDRSLGGTAGVKVIDFGLALDRKGGFMPPPGFRGYNLPYTSPQQQVSFNDVDERDDIYSMGLVFYEMLGGRLPDKGILPEEITMFPKTINRAIGRCIERERDRRWKDVNEMRKGLFGAA